MASLRVPHSRSSSRPAPTAVRNTFLPESMRPCGASVRGRRPGHSKSVGYPFACILALALAAVRSRNGGWIGLSGALFGAAWSRGERGLAYGGLSLLAPSPLRGEGWDEGRVLRRPSWFLVLALVARLLACGGLSCACRRPSYFSLRAQREVAKRNGLSSPPTLQALALEGLGTDRTLPVRPAATPHRRPQLRPGRGARMVAFRLLPPWPDRSIWICLPSASRVRMQSRKQGLSEAHPRKT
jgi:hypothetical protein